jgi:RNA polymerase sporulation-specific sigma factor
LRAALQQRQPGEKNLAGSVMFEALFHLLSKMLFFTSQIKNRSSFPKPLSPEEERKNFEKFKKHGDLEAKEKLIRHNLRLVAHIVRKYNNSAETDDLISVGTIGLIKAINTFEYNKGTQFATFAAKCIENEMLMLLRSNKKLKNNISLSEPMGIDKEGNELTLMNLLFVNEEGVFKQVENNILREKFSELLKKTLTEREFTIICHRYGLCGKSVLTQREIAKALNISRSYISRIEKKALEKIRKAIEKEKFFD